MKRSLAIVLSGLALSSLSSCTGCEREQASDLAAQRETLALPPNFQTLSAAEKQALIFDKEILNSRYEGELPQLIPVSPIKFIVSALRIKLEDPQDEAPVAYEKVLHPYGVVAKVKFEAEPGQPYSGLFQGVDHGLLRLSLTGDPAKMGFAPGLALKFLVDGSESQNVSALYKLTGQADNHNFFEHELSNIVPIEFDPKSLFSSAVFARVSRNPTKLSVKPFAAIDQKGQAVASANAPVQLYFVPTGAIRFESKAHDFREDFLGIPAQSVIYDVYATSEEGSNLRTIDAERRAKAIKIGRIVSTSAFVASRFGDSRLFFKHHRFED